jgi:hypothetical protein
MMNREGLASSWWVTLGAVALMGSLTFGCDEGIKTSASPRLVVDPTNVSFGKVAVGSTEFKRVQLKNEGTGDLIITQFQLNMGSPDYQLFYSPTGNEDEQFQGINGAGDDEFRYPVIIEPEASFYLFVDYKPTDNEPERGEVVVVTQNNPDPDREVAIPVGSVSGNAEINVSPLSHDFGAVAAPAEVSQDVEVCNRGQLPLNVERVLINGSQDYSPRVNDRDPRRDENVLKDPDGDGVDGLAPGACFTIVVTYAPQAPGPDAGDLIIESDDEQNPAVVVNLAANGATPCIDALPPAVEFPTSLVNRADSRPLTIESCGGGELEVTRIELDPASDPAFTLPADSLPELPFLLPASSPDAAPPSRQIRVEFTPREERVYNGKILLYSNDPLTPVKTVSLLGRGVLNACPQARATPEEYFVAPLDIVVLDGSASVDQDGPGNRPVKWEWVVTSRPEGSLSQPVQNVNAADPTTGTPDDTMDPIAGFFVDLAGTYTIELRVTDNLGLSSQECQNPAIITIVARPEEAILVQVTWDTPADPDQTDRAGTDVDLHLLNPLADSWFTTPYDCYYGNAEPDWGQLGNPSDDPVLDIDDINGGGPENVVLNQPENTDVLGGPYLVALHYYSSQERVNGADYGESIAQTRIFLNGDLAWDYTGMDENGMPEPGEFPLPASDHFCQIARIFWNAEPRVESAVFCSETRP